MTTVIKSDLVATNVLYDWSGNPHTKYIASADLQRMIFKLIDKESSSIEDVLDMSWVFANWNQLPHTFIPETGEVRQLEEGESAVLYDPVVGKHGLWTGVAAGNLLFGSSAGLHTTTRTGVLGGAVKSGQGRTFQCFGSGSVTITGDVVQPITVTQSTPAEVKFTADNPTVTCTVTGDIKHYQVTHEAHITSRTVGYSGYTVPAVYSNTKNDVKIKDTVISKANQSGEFTFVLRDRPASLLDSGRIFLYDAARFQIVGSEGIIAGIYDKTRVAKVGHKAASGAPATWFSGLDLATFGGESNAVVVTYSDGVASVFINGKRQQSMALSVGDIASIKIADCNEFGSGYMVMPSFVENIVLYDYALDDVAALKLSENIGNI